MVGVGSTIGNYEVLEKIGQGAMGAVYLARHPVIGKRVALKVIHSELAANEEIVSRFFNEARAVTQIGHPNIVDVQDFGQTPTGESFIVMELLEGVGLGTLLKREGTLSIERAVRISVQLCDGLRAAHARGIIHRDLKPDNIFLIARGADPDFVKILDFGLAKLTGPGAMAHKTRTGAVLGTAHYMAPEAAEDARKVDHRADVYALGCILFQLVTGRVPFPGDGFGEVLVRHIREAPPMPTRLRADVPSWLEKIILHALAKKPSFRFASMEDFGRALRDPASFERAFDDHELSDEELSATSVRKEAPPTADPAPTVRARASQIAADAKTVSTDAPPDLPELAWQGVGAGTARLADPVVGEATVKPEAGNASLVRRRTASALGFGASILGALAILGLAAGLVHRILYGEIALQVSTEPPGVQIVIGAHDVGTTPAQLKLPRSHTELTIVLQKVGYVSVRRTIEPSRDLALDVTLQPQPKPTPPPEPAPSEPPTAAPDDELAPAGALPDPLAPREDKPMPLGAAVAATTPTTGDKPKPKPAKHAERPRTPREPRTIFKKDGILLAPSF